ncbi:MAG: formimidoylglutamase [Brumimicrobium sp.]|nr:formimidoylglutamase [Brumimicrobium sp.]MCO5268132.1 formimidoylglutamase [Brumimicrobium sp.]
MKDISIYFQEVTSNNIYSEESLGNYIQKFQNGDFPKIQKNSIAILDIPEYRNAIPYPNKNDTHLFREKLYNLYIGNNWKHALYDLGTILPGAHIKDSFHALQSVCEELIKNNVIPIIIGGSQDLTKGIYDAYPSLEQLVNITTIDNRLDLGNLEDNLKEDGWLTHILSDSPCYLFNYTNIGAQTHYIPNSVLNLFNELYFDICRLGEVNNDIEIAEPYLRNTDVLSIDLKSIRASDIQNPFYTSPNGIFADQICRLARYAGISDKLSSIGIFNYYSNNNQTTDELVAQIIWYFNEGYSFRKGDFPIGSKKNYIKFKVFLEELDEEIIFYKSEKSARWWMEVPYPGTNPSKFLRHQLIPCSYQTYQNTMKGEIPDLWWKTYQKFT